MSTHTTHIESRQRNDRFAEFIKSEEMQQQMKNMNKSKCLQFLRDQFKQKYNETMPASAAYKVIATVDERFQPKQRVQTAKATPRASINDNPDIHLYMNDLIQRINEWEQLHPNYNYLKEFGKH